MAIPSFSSTVVARAAAALYGSQLGNGTMAAVLEEANATGGVEKLINTVYNRDYAAMSNADVAKMVVANLGITGAGVANAEAYLTAKITAAGAANEGAAIVAEVANFGALASDATYGAAATAFNGRIAAAVAYAQQGGTADRAFGAGSTISLTMGQDFLTGTSGNDTIVARIFDNQNTLQSGDWVDGGAGADKLEADMGASQDFAVTPETANVEWFSVRGQSRAFDNADNNVEGEFVVDVDAQRMSGVTRFDSTESRADVIIEDVRTSLRTKDITIGMIGTDAGNVDYAVYFDKLRADGTSTATLSLELMDTRAATSTVEADRALPLKDSPFNGFSFKVNGATVLLKDPVGSDPADVTTFNGAQTYAQLLVAVQKMLTAPANLAAYPVLAGITAELGAPFTARDTLTGNAADGTTIVLKGSSATALTLAPGNYIADAGVPSSSGLHTVQSTATSSSTDLVTATAILDNVGRGSNGGDLVIGAMSVGETSSSAGIARFEITVENTSNLGVISSTNNALKEVTFANGTVKGNVSVKGFDNTASLTAGSAMGDNNNALPGTTLSGVGVTHNAFGFTDVRMVDASAMTGTVTYDAVITEKSFGKYMQLTDTGVDPATDNDSTDGKTTRQVADFTYSGGAGNDSLFLKIDDAVAASHSNVQPGREDFTFTVNGNGGNDAISVRIDDGAAGGTSNWYEHQAMNQELNMEDRGGAGQVVINGGEGNDTIRKPGSGDVTIDGGAGNDTIYTDNTGSLTTANTVITNSGRAVWVMNTTEQDSAVVDIARDIDDLESDDNDHYFLFKATLTVTFRGVETQVPVTIGSLSADWDTSDLHINQAIKAAVNLDPVLSKVLVAQDGPGNSLVFRAQIDGDYTEDDELEIDIEIPDDLSTTDVNRLLDEWEAALDDGGYDLDEQGILDLMQDEVDSILTGADDDDYDAALANDGAAELTGADSTISTTDNQLTGGTGNDVFVLSTTFEDGSSGTEEDSSNETLHYTGTFGDDTIFNFGADGGDDADDSSDDDGSDGSDNEGDDVLDFSALGADGDELTFDITDADSPEDGAIFVVDLEDEFGVDPEDLELADIEDLFTEDADDDEDYIFIAVDDHNIGHVYHVTDAEGEESAEAVFLGTIDLADTDWFDLSVANFGGGA